MNTRPRSLVDELVGHVGRPRLAVALAVWGVLVLLLIATVFAHAGRAPGSARGLWKTGLEPAVIVYILWVYPPLHRRWTLATDALRSLADRPEDVERAYACLLYTSPSPRD